MTNPRDIVITGFGAVTPVGVGVDALWEGLLTGRSGIDHVRGFDPGALPAKIAGELRDFEPKQFVKPRKVLKLMSPVIEMAYVAAQQAWNDAGLAEETHDPDRVGVVLGCDMIYGDKDELASVFRHTVGPDGHFDLGRWYSAVEGNLNPLWMLKHLPNMAASHIAIGIDARGPNNTHTLGDVSPLLAVAEAARVIQRGVADVMVVGGAGSRLPLAPLLRWVGDDVSCRNDEPQRASRPFDAERDGQVNSQGAGILVLEAREFAERRGADIRGRLLKWASAFEPLPAGHPITGAAIQRVIRGVLPDQDQLAELSHVNAYGVSSPHDDEVEAQAIQAQLGNIPVTANKGHLGNLASGGGAVELIATVRALQTGQVPPTLNYEHPDIACPVQVVRDAPLHATGSLAVKLSHDPSGQAAALLIGK